MYKIKRAVAVISDMHTGSELALWPEGFILNADDPKIAKEIKLNSVQKKLLPLWHQFLEACDYWHVDVVIDLSDSIEGLNKKSFAAGLVTPSLNEQIRANITLIKPLIRGRTFYNLSGSDYHESTEINVYEDICKQISEGGYAKKAMHLGIVANLNIEGTKRIINVAHGASAAIQYRATAMDREGMNNLVAFALDELPKADIILRGHGHRFMHLHLPKQHIVALPCWKAYQPVKKYMAQYSKAQPSIGAVIIVVDEDDRIRILPYLYKSPVKLLGDLAYV